jgi:hypothetical protein
MERRFEEHEAGIEKFEADGTTKTAMDCKVGELES